ncbi:hypothetical protein K457DRAFT_100091 [Linnemannia elongata AG-77]|uniref:Inhibitor I9 domain-containing protein n=1 Tax=Linnemannia elongata AG-77 TaxID=1314771 RepID=A0A197JIJ6_9FUNG|nr:hypothetical protein K457DRAFT_100091 [Linnemannia elongata AG-77]
MTSDNDANAFSASVLPGGIQQPGQAPSTIPKKGAQAAGARSNVIVVFKQGTPQPEITKAEDDIIAQGGKITQRYTSALLGFAAELPDNSVQALTTNPHLNYIEPDGEVSAYAKSLI